MGLRLHIRSYAVFHGAVLQSHRRMIVKSEDLEEALRESSARGSALVIKGREPSLYDKLVTEREWFYEWLGEEFYRCLDDGEGK